MTDAVPHRLGGRYEVGNLLGRGGMADVHRARDLVLGREVAVKVLRTGNTVDAERFASEAMLLARLNHPSVVTVLDAGTSDDQPWLALELVEGRTLDAVLRDDSPDPPALAALAAQVADALAHAHLHGIVHRDVKPSNVLVTDAGVAKLSDFGIARLADAGSALTLTGHTIGTAAYLSPEQVRGGPVDGASDVYALGLVLLEALTGTRAYPGPAVEAALARLHRSPLIPTSLPPGWSGLIATMTSAAAADRPPAEAVATRLRALSGAAGPVPNPDWHPDATGTFSVPRPPSPLALTPEVGPTVGSSRRRRPVLLLAAAVALLLSLVTLARGLGGDDVAMAGAAPAPTTERSPSSSPTSPASPASSPAGSPGASATPSIAAVTDQPTPSTARPTARSKATKNPPKTGKHGPGKSGKSHAKGGKGKANGHGKGSGKGKGRGKG